VGIPIAIARDAYDNRGSSRYTSADEVAETERWEQSMGADGDANHRISENVATQIGILVTRNQEAQQALANLRADPSDANVQAAITARDNLRSQITAVETAYQAYRDIPYEADAHEVGVSTAHAYRQL